MHGPPAHRLSDRASECVFVAKSAPNVHSSARRVGAVFHALVRCGYGLAQGLAGGCLDQAAARRYGAQALIGSSPTSTRA